MNICRLRPCHQRRETNLHCSPIQKSLVVDIIREHGTTERNKPKHPNKVTNSQNSSRQQRTSDQSRVWAHLMSCYGNYKRPPKAMKPIDHSPSHLFHVCQLWDPERENSPLTSFVTFSVRFMLATAGQLQASKQVSFSCFLEDLLGTDDL